MNNNTYNGYTNWDTWNVELWIDNEEPIYRAKWRLLRNTDVDAEEVEEFCRNEIGETTPDGADFSEVDWKELAEHWNAERKENGYADEEEEEELETSE